MHLRELLHREPLPLGLVAALAFVLRVGLSGGPCTSAACAREVGLRLGALLARVLPAALLVHHGLHKLLLELLLRGRLPVGARGAALQILEAPHEWQRLWLLDLGLRLLLELLRGRLPVPSLVLLLRRELALALMLLRLLALWLGLLLELVGLRLALGLLLLNTGEGRPELRPEVCQLGLLGVRRVRLGLLLARCLWILLARALVAHLLGHRLLHLPLG